MNTFGASIGLESIGTTTCASAELLLSLPHAAVPTTMSVKLSFPMERIGTPIEPQFQSLLRYVRFSTQPKVRCADSTLMNHPGLKYSLPMLTGRRVLFLFLVVGCTKANPSATCDNGSCTDPNFSYCDTDGSVGGVPGDCVAVSCTPGEIKECRGSNAITCSVGGNGYELQPCDLGCSDTPASHCKYLQPKYMPLVCDTPATVANVSMSSNGMLDPNLDASCTGGIISQGICVVRAATIEVTSGTVLTVVGSPEMNGRAIAFVADSDLSVSGTIDVSGHTGINGPGGGTFVSGGAYSYSSQSGTSVGAGGAGGATAGGAGATGTNMAGGSDGGAANGGAAVMNPALLASFMGGASTIRVGMPDASFGGGGGALMLVSCHGTVNVTGILNAGGGGGDAGYIAGGIIPVFSRGGGAGGNVVIQGRNVTFTGQAFANGGGGGEGFESNGTLGTKGGDGPASDAAGGVGGNSSSGGGAGGTGGWIRNNPLVGKHPTANNGGVGAGGGSVGFLQIYTPMGTTPTVTPSHVSPAFQPNGVVETR